MWNARINHFHVFHKLKALSIFLSNVHDIVLFKMELFHRYLMQMIDVPCYSAATFYSKSMYMQLVSNTHDCRLQ